jgi:hypothetical protein
MSEKYGLLYEEMRLICVPEVHVSNLDYGTGRTQSVLMEVPSVSRPALDRSTQK